MSKILIQITHVVSLWDVIDWEVSIRYMAGNILMMVYNDS